MREDMVEEKWREDGGMEVGSKGGGDWLPWISSALNLNFYCLSS